MNYKRIYQELINSRLNNIPDGYKEEHHIIPRCMKGTDEPENMVYLIAREHFLAHYLLYKMYPEHDSLVYALNWMSNQKHYNQSSRMYENIRKIHSKVQSNMMIEYFKDPKNRKKQAEKKIKYFKDPKNRKKQAKLIKEYWANLESRKKHAEIFKKYYKDPENKKKQAKLIKEYREDPLPKSKNPFTIHGVFFNNTVEARKKLDVNRSTISRRLINPNFPEYQYI